MFLFLLAGPIIDLIAQGLSQTDPVARDIAVLQLRIMSPMALLAGLIGIGFGTLNADNQFWLPSLSPIFSSGAVLVGLGLLFCRHWARHYQSRVLPGGWGCTGSQYPGRCVSAVVGPAAGPVEVWPGASQAAL